LIRWYAHAVSHNWVGRPNRVSHRICESYNLGHGVVPTVFWGRATARGGKKFSLENSPSALILMGDWCAPKPDTDRLKTGARDLDDQTLTG
jgi:hypothetical protein